MGFMAIFLRNFFSYDKVRKLFFLRIYGKSDLKYNSEVCHSLIIYQRLELKTATIDDFGNFKILGGTETRTVFSRV